MFRSKEFEAMETERRFMCGSDIHATHSSALKPMRRPSDYMSCFLSCPALKLRV